MDSFETSSASEHNQPRTRAKSPATGMLRFGRGNASGESTAVRNCEFGNRKCGVLKKVVSWLGTIGFAPSPHQECFCPCVLQTHYRLPLGLSLWGYLFGNAKFSIRCVIISNVEHLFWSPPGNCQPAFPSLSVGNGVFRSATDLPKCRLI
jgi:hypothetical protein